MSVVLKVSYWEPCLSVTPLAPDEVLFRDWRLGLLIEGRRILLFDDPSPSGHVPSQMDRDRNGGLGLFYRWRAPVDFARPLPNFCRHDVEFAVGDGYMECELGEDHELPLPKLYSGGHRDPHALARREFERRCRSAFGAGGEDELAAFLRGVPDGFRRFLPVEAWRGTVDTVRAEGGDGRCT